MTDAPERIWTFGEYPDSWVNRRSGVWVEDQMDCPDGSPDYILASALSDPNRVHANMLRGAIAKPTLGQIIHLYGVDALCKALALVIVREAGDEQA